MRPFGAYQSGSAATTLVTPSPVRSKCGPGTVPAVHPTPTSAPVGDDLGVGVRRARRQLEANLGLTAISVGLFGVPDPEVARSVVALAAGSAAFGGMSVATGEAVDRVIALFSGGPPRPAGMPGHVVVVATAEGVLLFAHSYHSAVGKEAAFFGAGHFKAHASRYPFTIGLSITADSGERLVLNGKRGPRHGVAPTVKAVLALASGTDRPIPGRHIRS